MQHVIHWNKHCQRSYWIQWSRCDDKEGLSSDAILEHTPSTPLHPLGYHAPVASNTPSQNPDSTPTQGSISLPSHTALPFHSVPCSTASATVRGARALHKKRTVWQKM